MSATKRELIEERWDVLMREVAVFKGESAISSVNSKRFYRINETLEELAAMLVDEVNEDEMDNAQRTGLQTATEGIWDEIRERLVSWAERIEQERAQRLAQRDAESHVAA